MGYWRTQLERFKEHIKTRSPESFFILSADNSRNMKTVYARFNDITAFITELEYKADLEDAGFGSGAIGRTIGGSE